MAITRRDFLKAAVIGGVSLSIIPNYLENVFASEKNEELMIYLFPDIHTTSFHEAHYKKILKLNEDEGLSLVCFEGHAGQFTNKNLEEMLETVIKQQELGVKEQLSSNEEKYSSKKDDGPERIATLDDLKKVRPVFKILDLNNIRLYGVEDKELQSKLGTLLGISKLTGLSNDIYLDIRNMEYALQTHDYSKNHTDKTRFEEIKGHIEEQGKNLAKIKKLVIREIGQILSEEDMPRNFKTPRESYGKFIDFSNRIDSLIDEYNNKRSINAAHLCIREMKSANKNKAALIYGEEHMDKIKEEIEKRNASYKVVQ